MAIMPAKEDTVTISLDVTSLLLQGAAESSFQITNVSIQDVLVQIQPSNNVIVLSPSMVRVPPQMRQMIKVKTTTARNQLPQDSESLFALTIKVTPAGQETSGSPTQLTVKYRPSGYTP